MIEIEYVKIAGIVLIVSFILMMIVGRILNTGEKEKMPLIIIILMIFFGLSLFIVIGWQASKTWENYSFANEWRMFKALLVKILFIIIVVALGIIIYSIKKYYSSYLNNKRLAINEKAKILINNYPPITLLYRKLISKERDSINRSREYIDDYDGDFSRSIEIFGVKNEVYFNSNVDIEKIIKEKIQELEEDNKGREIINNVISDVKKYRNKLIKEEERKLLEIKRNHLKYGPILKSFLQNEKVFKSKGEIINFLMNHLEISEAKSEFIFEELTSPETSILTEKFSIAKDKLQKYYYSYEMVAIRIDNIKEKIYKYSIKFH